MKPLEIADRILAITGIIGTVILVACAFYEMGRADGVDSVQCKPIVKRAVISTEELGRMYRARLRMEKVK